MRPLLVLGLISCLTYACATATDDVVEDGSGGSNFGLGGASTGGVTGVGGASTGGVTGVGGAATGGAATGGAATGGAATGGAATGGAATGGDTGTGGTVSTSCDDAVEWVSGQHSVNYPPGQLFNYEGKVYRYDGTEPMTYVNPDCPPDQSGEPWCQSGSTPWSEVTC